MLTLYSREECPHCQRVRRWLSTNGAEYTLVEVPRLRSQRVQLRARVGGEPTVPVLVDGEVVIQGMEEILAHLESHHRHPGYGEPTYGLTRNLGRQSWEASMEAVRSSLAAQGFGVITEIDVQQTLKKKLNQDFRPYVILGACNPPIAHRALSGELGVGLLLPCNVVVTQDEDGSVIVSAIDPQQLFTVVNRPDLETFASDVKSLLVKALDGVTV